ncbi:MAG: YraN family protein [Legionella sp.]|nr:MAG: YraN family protein [Legionella sp.]
MVFTQKSGHQAEERASNYLQGHGLKLVGRNYHCFAGEIDLIMRDKEYFVFIEVRSRVNVSYGGGIDTITYGKRQKIIKTATHYLMRNQIYEKYPVRFDVIGIDGKSGELSWIKDAFGTNY